MAIPLKQGLKQQRTKKGTWLYIVDMAIPLKQGLKQFVVIIFGSHILS